MNLLEHIALFDRIDALGLATLFLLWFASSVIIEHAPKDRPSVAQLMVQYRQTWMQEFVTRQPRIFDASILTTLRQGTTFFASASMIGIGGALALIGNTERLLGVARDLSLESAPALVWEIKILIIILFVANAFLKFVWAHRLFGYCAVIMASVPNNPDHPHAYQRAAQAADVCNNGSRSFNRGMRSLYFSLAGLAWLLGALAMIVASGIIFLMLWRREFTSDSRKALMQNTPL